MDSRGWSNFIARFRAFPLTQWVEDGPFFSSTPQCSSCAAKHYMVAHGMTSWCETPSFACFESSDTWPLLFQLLDSLAESPKCQGRFCDKGQKCKISLNLSLGSLEVFICGESSPKFQMYNAKKAIGALTREKSKCHNWNTRKCRKSTQVRNFDLQSVRRGNWERLWGREGRFPCTHISTPKVQNYKNIS